MSHNNDEDWGRDTLSAENMLYIFGGAKDPRRSKALKEAINDPEHGRLFVHDVCYGQRYTYTIEHVNQLLTADDNPDQIKERIVELLPRLSDKQKRWVVEGITSGGLEVVREINPSVAEAIRGRTSRHPPLMLGNTPRR
ncbi:MAG: hypothetical protein AB7L92_08810 [Alphaproteobacteria bacterium]